MADDVGLGGSSGTSGPGAEQTLAADRAIAGSAILARLERLPFSRFHVPFYAFLGVGTFFDAYDSLAIASALSVVFVTLHISFSQAGQLLGIAYIGQLVGALVFGAASERFGRKPVFIAALVVFGVFSLVSAFSWSYTSLFWFRILEGFGLGGEVPVAVALINEVVKGSKRGKFVALYEALFSWGIFLTPLVAYVLLRIFGAALSWRLLFGIGVIPALIAIPAIFFLPESPRWLIDNGHEVEANRMISNAEDQIRARGTMLPDPVPMPPADTQRTRFVELLSPGYLGRTVMLWIIWFTAYFVVYGFGIWLPSLYVRVGHLPASRSLLLTAISGAVGVAASYALVLVLDRFGRRPTFQAAYTVMIVGGVFGYVSIGLLHHASWPWLFVTALVMLTGGDVLAIGVYIYTPELYPTRMRGWGTSFCSTGSRLASYLGPVIIGDILAAKLGLSWIFLLMIIASVLGMVLLSLYGPETKGRVLEELAR